MIYAAILLLGETYLRNRDMRLTVAQTAKFLAGQFGTQTECSLCVGVVGGQSFRPSLLQRIESSELTPKSAASAASRLARARTSIAEMEQTKTTRIGGLRRFTSG